MHIFHENTVTEYNNLKQNIVGKSSKLTRKFISFSIECFATEFSQFCRTVEICVLGDWLNLLINSKHFRDFLEIS